MGIPGAGKTHTFSKLAEEKHYVYLAADTIRDRLGIPPGSPSTEQVLEELKASAIREYTNGHTVIIDGSFLHPERRKSYIEAFRENGVQRIEGILINTLPEIAWVRNQARANGGTSRVLFDDRVRLLAEFPPSLNEGFDSISVL